MFRTIIQISILNNTIQDSMFIFKGYKFIKMEDLRIRRLCQRIVVTWTLKATIKRKNSICRRYGASRWIADYQEIHSIYSLSKICLK